MTRVSLAGPSEEPVLSNAEGLVLNEVNGIPTEYLEYGDRDREIFRNQLKGHLLTGFFMHVIHQPPYIINRHIGEDAVAKVEDVTRTAVRPL